MREPQAKLDEEAGLQAQTTLQPPNKLDEEAEVQQKSHQKVQAKLHKERGNYQNLARNVAKQVG